LTDLLLTKHVLICRDAAPLPRSPAYDGPYLVLEPPLPGTYIQGPSGQQTGSSKKNAPQAMPQLTLTSPYRREKLRAELGSAPAHSSERCSGSGGSVSFWASWIRIRNNLYGSDLEP
jgi:hypothetical protein